MHNKAAIGLIALATAICGAAQGQPAAPTPTETATASEQAVIPYPPEFFADAHPSTALDMVRRLPGFTFDTGGNVRGFEGGGGNVLIDGRRSVSKAEGLDEILRRIPAGSVLRIDLIRGGATGIDMQGRTILANVIRRPGGGLTGAFQSNSGFMWDGRVIAGGRIELQRRWPDHALEGSFVYSRPVDDGLANGTRVRTDAAGNEFFRSEVTAHGDGAYAALSGAYETPLWAGSVRVNGSLISDPFYQDILDQAPGGDFEHEVDEFASRRAEVGLRYSLPLARGLTSETVFLQQVRHNPVFVDFTSPGVDRIFDLDRTSGETVLHGDLNWTRSPQLSFKFGAEGAFNWLRSETNLLIDGTPITLPAANVRVEELRGEVLAEATWRPRPTLTLEAGLHVEASTIRASGDVDLEKTLYFPKPRLNVTWTPWPSNQFRFRIEREVGQLNFGDFVAASSVANTGTAIAGNPDIVPQQDWLLEAVYERRFWTDGVFSLTYRHYLVSDVIDRIPLAVGNDVIEMPGNIGDGVADAAIVDVTIPLARFGLAGAQLKPRLTWQRSEVTDPVTGERRRFAGQHPLDWEIHFTHDIPAWRVNWGVDIFGRFTEVGYGVTEIDTFEVHTYVGAFAEYKPSPHWLFRVELQNMTGRDTIYTREVYEGPRNTSPLAFVDRRPLEPGPMLFLRVRRTI